MSLACPAPYLTPSVDCFHNSSTKLGPNTRGEYNAYIRSRMDPIFWGLWDLFSTFCHISEQNLAHSQRKI